MNINLVPVPEEELKPYVYYLATNHLPTPEGKNLICYTLVELEVAKDKRSLIDLDGVPYRFSDFHSFYELPRYEQS